MECGQQSYRETDHEPDGMGWYKRERFEQRDDPVPQCGDGSRAGKEEAAEKKQE
jgi:hypothetical protein